MQDDRLVPDPQQTQAFPVGQLSAGLQQSQADRGEAGSFPVRATGPDGNVWFARPQDVQIGRITPAGVVTEDDVPAGNSTPVGIASGADGNLWSPLRTST
ncbi:hypothetical protein ACIGO6_40015 [Streptomyces sp. NPDC053750]|uniref:virginiamycin B lyase family protein n=1 Tax=Streptomyces sp. NPDC053750 TaxID=3365714 RepID=UPI0037CDED85